MRTKSATWLIVQMHGKVGIFQREERERGDRNMRFVVIDYIIEPIVGIKIDNACMACTVQVSQAVA